MAPAIHSPAGHIRSSGNGRQSAISRKMNGQPAKRHFDGAVAQQAAIDSLLRIATRAHCVSCCAASRAFQGQSALIVMLAIHSARINRRGTSQPCLSPDSHRYAQKAVTAMACSSSSLPPSSEVMPFPCTPLPWTPFERLHGPQPELERTNTSGNQKSPIPRSLSFASARISSLALKIKSLWPLCLRHSFEILS